MWFKKLTTPKTNETKQTDAVQMWEVRWRSRHGEYSSDTRPELEAFTSEADAEAFAESLKAAYRLTRNTSGNRVELRKAATA
jgi:hypothetical protein